MAVLLGNDDIDGVVGAFLEPNLSFHTDPAVRILIRQTEDANPPAQLARFGGIDVTIPSREPVREPPNFDS